MKLKRFDIEDNSWSHDIKEHIEGLLKMIPTDDLEIDVAKVIYDGLVHFFGDYWSVVCGGDLDIAIKYSFGYMFSIYDNAKEQNIICFKPDPLRGKFKKYVPDSKSTSHILPVKVIENSMSDDLYRLTIDSIRELIPWYHEEPIDTEIAGCLRTAISERYTGVYQVAVSFNEPLEYHLDPNAVDVFYAQAGLYFILVWKMVVSADMLKVPNRRKWYEKTIITVIWVTVLFALIFLVGNVYMKIGDIDSQCKVGECDREALKILLGTRENLLRVTILVAGFYFYYLTFRYLRTRQRHTADMNHYKSILFGTKEDSPVCWNKHNTLRIVFSSWSPHGKP